MLYFCIGAVMLQQYHTVRYIHLASPIIYLNEYPRPCFGNFCFYFNHLLKYILWSTMLSKRQAASFSNGLSWQRLLSFDSLLGRTFWYFHAMPAVFCRCQINWIHHSYLRFGLYFLYLSNPLLFLRSERFHKLSRSQGQTIYAMGNEVAPIIRVI
jgi:hypothetical protein